MLSISDIKHSFYINLNIRPDRKKATEYQLSRIGIEATRFEAIRTQNGRVGCSISHLKCIEHAKKNGWDHVLFCEDDISFLDPELFKTQLNFFLENHYDWDVLLLAGNNVPPYTQIDKSCIKVRHCQTTTGYIVKAHYYDTLIQNIREGILNLTVNPDEHVKYAIDKNWLKLQKIDNWYLIIPLTVVQSANYSDIECKCVDYSKIMIDVDKPYLFKPRL